MTACVELQVLTHFSLLRGASSPEELFSAAALLGYPAIGVSDIGTVAVVVRALGGSEGDGRSFDRRCTHRSRLRAAPDPLSQARGTRGRDQR